MAQQAPTKGRPRKASQKSTNTTTANESAKNVTSERVTPGGRKSTQTNTKMPNIKDKNSWVFELIGMTPAQYVLRNNFENMAYDEDDGEYKSIRHAKGVSSIFVDKQPPNVTKEQVVFEDGWLEVSNKETMLFKWLFKHPHFGKTFRLLDKAKDSQANLEQFQLEQKARDKVLNSYFSDVKTVALVLGIDTSIEEVCREKLVLEAMKDPERLLDMFDNELIQIKSDVVQAFNQGIITNDKDRIFWEGGNKIFSYPTGSDPSDYMADRLLREDEASQKILEELRKRLAE